jgi:hypothetical protein
MWYILFSYPHSTSIHVLSDENGKALGVNDERHVGKLVGLAHHMVDNNIIASWRLVKTVET